MELTTGLEPVDDENYGRFSVDAQRKIRERLRELEAARLRGEAESHQVYVGS